jgi:hypothetical protein
MEVVVQKMTWGFSLRFLLKKLDSTVEIERIVCSEFALPADPRETEMVSLEGHLWKDMAFLAAMLILCAMPLALVLVLF